jgi:hypothetical protein
MRFGCGGTGEEAAVYISATEPKPGTAYLRCTVYRGTHQRGERIQSGKSGKYYCRWTSKAEVEKPESIRQFLEKLKPVSHKPGYAYRIYPTIPGEA